MRPYCLLSQAHGLQPSAIKNIWDEYGNLRLDHIITAEAQSAQPGSIELKEMDRTLQAAAISEPSVQVRHGDYIDNDTKKPDAQKVAVTLRLLALRQDRVENCLGHGEWIGYNGCAWGCDRPSLPLETRSRYSRSRQQSSGRPTHRLQHMHEDDIAQLQATQADLANAMARDLSATELDTLAKDVEGKIIIYDTACWHTRAYSTD